MRPLSEVEGDNYNFISAIASLMPDFSGSPADDVPTDQPWVHVWGLSLSQPPAAAQEWAHTLSQQEWQRAARFSQQCTRLDTSGVDPRTRFILSRGGLRYLLSRYLGAAADTLTFAYTDRGKPYLYIDNQASFLHFNLSHAGHWVIYGISDCPLGIDIEQIRPLKYLAGLIKRCLTPREQAHVSALDPMAAEYQFLRYWTSKEAYLKAIGEGLAYPMDAIEIEWTPLGLKNSKGQLLPEWGLHCWEPDQNYIAALVADHRCQVSWKPLLSHHQERSP